MKKATPTPNRSTTFTRSWQVRTILFLFVTFLLSCEDNSGLIGTPKEKRFKVLFKEFNIPASTVQVDSILSSQSIGRVLCGRATDPNFGEITATSYLQFAPQSVSKIDKTDKSDFQVESVFMYLVLSHEYYVFSQNNAATNLTFGLHEITDNSFFYDKRYYADSPSPAYNMTPIASAVYEYNPTKIAAWRTLNTDANNNNNDYDSIPFELPKGVGSFGQALLDTLLKPGIKTLNATTNQYFFSYKNDSIFRRNFPGFALIPGVGNDKILGFHSPLSSFVNSTVIKLRYSYLAKDATSRTFVDFYYTPETAPTFTKVEIDRSGKPLEGITEYTDFTAPDDYVYVQSGGGTYAKLDFSEVHSYFNATPDTILNMAVNSAELVIELESKTTRPHLVEPEGLRLRLLKPNNRFYVSPTVTNTAGSSVVDPKFESSYFVSDDLNPEFFLDGISEDGNFLNVSYKEFETARYYRTHLTGFLHRHLKLPNGFAPIMSFALIPAKESSAAGARESYSKSLSGVSFKKDKVKLRVYYTRTL